MLVHSFPPIVNAYSNVLILGTMPGNESLRQQQYYAHSRNSFWKIMFTLFNEKYTDDYHQRTQLLLKHHIALWDVLQHCERSSSADTDIRKPVPNDITGLLQRHGTIRHIFFNGKGAEQLYRKLITETEAETTTLPSTSPANTLAWQHKLEQWKVLAHYV